MPGGWRHHHGQDPLHGKPCSGVQGTGGHTSAPETVPYAKWDESGHSLMGNALATDCWRCIACTRYLCVVIHENFTGH